MRFFGPLFLALVSIASAQNAPYDVVPDVAPPYYRVRYEASDKPGELIYAVKYTVWVPPGVEKLRGVVVHQHGCGEGSCKSGLTGAFDLHWQALARKHGCALMAPSYEQPQEAECQMWCDPRNGSDVAFQKALKDLGEQSGHPELATVPWALWGHSGGGHWAGGMTFLHSDRVAAAWLRSGVPFVKPDPDRESIRPYAITDGVLTVPIMCNPGTKEGVTVKEGRFARVWPANETFFTTLRENGALIGVSVDPLTAHECGNQRYMAIRWLDACLGARLPDKRGEALKPMPSEGVWLAELLSTKASPAGQFEGDAEKAVWLPNAKVAKLWEHYVTDTEVPDATPPPSPTNLQVKGQVVTWEATADLESGIAHFEILRDGETIATVPETPKNPFGRPLFQGLQYSDTPLQPLVEMRFEDSTKPTSGDPRYQVIAVNTVGLASAPSAAEPSAAPEPPEGFRTLFNGEDLSGWYGWNPHQSAKLEGEKKVANLEEQRAEFADHWQVENGELVNIGTGPYATTEEAFGDIEFLIEYKTVAKADSGIYLRGTPQIQIWDTTLEGGKTGAPRFAEKGSGGLFNNSKGAPGQLPLVNADKPFGEWNQFRIRQIGDKTWVWLNDQLVVDGNAMENYWDREKSLPAKGPIMLQTHGGEIRWRNLFVREIGKEEAKAILSGQQ